MAYGFVKLHRVWADWELLKYPNCGHVMAYFLAIAQHDFYEYNGVELGPGQLLISTRKTAEKLGLSHQQFRTVLGRFLATHQITHQATQEGTVITLLKWDKFQGRDEDATQDATQSSTHINKNINNKNINNKKKNINTDVFIKKADAAKILYEQLTTTTHGELILMNQKIKTHPTKLKKFIGYFMEAQESFRSDREGWNNVADLRTNFASWAAMTRTRQKYSSYLEN